MVKQILKSIFIMSFVSVLMLLVLSVLTYALKWKADAALIGITLTYILTGFVGGKVKKRMSYEMNMLKKLFEGFVIGTIFMLLLVLLSVVVTDSSFVISERFFMIWMLITGSAALGRIL